MFINGLYGKVNRLSNLLKFLYLKLVDLIKVNEMIKVRNNLVKFNFRCVIKKETDEQ